MHHTRRKSGNASLTDVRKAVAVSDLPRPRRPQLARKATPQAVLKLGKSARDREKEWQEEKWWEDERESFPQYCMSCEKQFMPQDAIFLYCSEACRKHDQSSTATISAYPPSRCQDASQSFYSAGNLEPRDIIPQASPSRPSSYCSPPTTPTATAQYSSAVSALRSLTMRPPSPPSPTTAGSCIWPFTRSAATSPSTSYTRQTSFFSSTYDNGYGASAYNYSHTTANVMGSDRPLPSRTPGAYGRPKSIELVTPMVRR